MGLSALESGNKGVGDGRMLGAVGAEHGAGIGGWETVESNIETEL